MPKVEWFFANVPFESTEEDVENFLRQAPGVKVGRVRLKYDQNGQSRGFGFADVLIEGDDLERPIREIFGKKLGGRSVSVEMAKTRRRDEGEPYLNAYPAQR